jgi:hypothetical protein
MTDDCQSDSSQNSILEERDAILRGPSFPELVLTVASKSQPNLAFCASEDLVRKRYDRVMGVHGQNEGWRSAMSQGVRHSSSTLEFLRKKSSFPLRGDLRRSSSQSDAEFAEKLVLQQKQRAHAIQKSKNAMARCGMGESNEMSLSFAGARILKRRGWPDTANGTEAGPSRRSCRRKETPNMNHTLFPSCTCTCGAFYSTILLMPFE